MPRLNILKAMTGIRWGAHPTNLLNVYKGFIRPLLDWGCQSFNPLDEILYLKISRLQYAALKAVSGLMTTTPTNVLLDINGEFPLDARWQGLTLRFLAKVMARRSHPLRRLIKDLCDLPVAERDNICLLTDTFFAHTELFGQTDTFHLPGYLEFPYECRHLDLAINTDLGHRVAADIDPASSFERLTSSLKYDASFYTDGSRSELDNRAGFAVFSPELDLEHKERINNNCTIFEAEAFVIQNAIDIVLEGKTRRAVIFSDSLSVLSSLDNPVSTGITHHGILKIRSLLSECFKQALIVHLFWIPSHRGIPGNERADILAKESLRLPDTFLLSKCHYTNLYSKFKAISKGRASQIILIESLHKRKRYFNDVRDVLAPPWYNDKNIRENLTRPIVTFISRLRSYHTTAKGHFFYKNISDSAECSCGHLFQDMNHIFFHCPNLHDDSNLLITQLHSIAFDITLDIPTLAFSNNTRIFRLLHGLAMRKDLII
ncbi:uncharacterized protein [Polyergus mexicanus]|uniref:uncharacterized protein n=1 Tax=Polyergus mexicanus TaxID=615972 RepID=UPI0038B622E8